MNTIEKLDIFSRISNESLHKTQGISIKISVSFVEKKKIII